MTQVRTDPATSGHGRTLELILWGDDFERVFGLKDDDTGQAYERRVLALLD